MNERVNHLYPRRKVRHTQGNFAKKGIDNITYFDVMGRGRLERPSYERIVQGYRTNQTFVPDFVSRLRIELIVEDAKAKDITNTIKQDGNIKGNIFVYDVSESHEL